MEYVYACKISYFQMISGWRNAFLKIRQEVSEGAEEKGDETKKAKRKEEKQAQVFSLSNACNPLTAICQVEVIQRVQLRE